MKTGGYPLPDNPVSITASGTPIGSQGYAGASVLSLLKMSDVKDPLDRTTPYTYLVNSIRTKYQLLSFLEDGSNVSLSYRSLLPAGEGLGVSSVYADTSDYSKRFVLTKGDALGVLLASGTMVPVQVSGTGVDILNTTGSYVMQFDNSTKVSGSGIVLKSGIVSTKGLVGYWDMETMSGGKLMDLSGNGNDGTMSGTTSSGGKLGNGRSFNGVSDYINIMQGVTLDIPNTITVSSWIKA